MNFEQAMEKLFDAIIADYEQYCMQADGKISDYSASQIEKMKTRETLYYTTGGKYSRVVKDGSAWGFIVMIGDGKFKAGDILKSASWAAPAKNAARGNIYGEYSVMWTGPLYLK